MFQHLQICPTWRCNLKCPTCDSWQRDQKIELSKGQIDQIAKDELFGRVKHLIIEGGEPFTFTNLDYFIDKMSRVYDKIAIITSGYLYARIGMFLEKYAGIKNRLRFVVSLNGIDKYHDETRGKDGVYAHVINTIALLQSHGYAFNLQFLPTETNQGQYWEVKEFADKLGVSVNVCHPSKIGKYAIESTEGMLKEYDIIKAEQAKSLPWRSRWEFECFNDMKKRKKFMPCWAGKKMIYIDPRGTIRPCAINEEMSLGIIYDHEIFMKSGERYQDELDLIPEYCQYRTGQVCNQTYIGYTLHRKPFYLLKWRLGKWLRKK